MGRAEKHRILLVDDDDTVTVVFAELLRANGYDVDVAKNGEGGLASVVNQRYDLIRSDWDMPFGYQDFIRVLADTDPEVPVLVVSGYLVEEDLGQVRGLPNFAGYFRKPVDTKTYLRTVRQIIEGRAARR